MRNNPLFLLGSVCVVALSCGGDDGNGGVPTADFTVTIENIGPTRAALASGVFDTPVGAGTSGPLVDTGDAYEFTVTAPPGQRLNLVSMLAPSNDFFVASAPEGIPLFLEPTGQPLNGVVTSQFAIYDLGTEEDQPLGAGDTQYNPGGSPGQNAANIGPRDDDDTVRLADAPNLPAVADFLEVRVTPSQNTPGEVTEFTVRIVNRSTDATLALPSGGTRGVILTPGLWVIHGAEQAAPFFTVGAADRGQGLEGLAEDGNPSGLSAQLAPRIGPQVPLSPGAFAVFSGDSPLPGLGSMASAGLEALAEDGLVDALATELAAESTVQASGTIPAMAAGATPIQPGQSYQFGFRALAPASLTFATMYVQSNDVYLAPSASGIELFQGDTPVTGSVSDQVELYDAGTEVNEEPGIGPNQAPRQSSSGQGVDEGGRIRRLSDVQDGFEYQSASETIRVTITGTPR